MGALDYIVQLMAIDHYREALGDNQTENWKRTMQGRVKNTCLIQKQVRSKINCTRVDF